MVLRRWRQWIAVHEWLATSIISVLDAERRAFKYSSTWDGGNGRAPPSPPPTSGATLDVFGVAD
jgi:hypothetical protein